MINIDEEEYFKKYKDIYKVCIKNGEVFPTLFSLIYLPDQYRFREVEKEKLDNSISFEMRKEIEKKSVNKRLIERNIMVFEDYEDKINEFYMNELVEFFRKYPEFKIISI